MKNLSLRRLLSGFVAALLVTALLVTAQTGCQRAATPSEAPTPPAPDATAPDASSAPPLAFRFVESAAARGIDFRHDSGARGEYLLRETNSGGGGFWDPDGDGDPDALLLSGAPVGYPPSTIRLYVNDGAGLFHDATATSGLRFAGDAQTFATADVDDDGDADLVVAGYGTLRLFVNEGGLRFSDATERWGLGTSEGFANAAAFIDAERDGRPDLAVGIYSVWTPAKDRAANCRRSDGERTYCEPWIFPPARLRLFGNTGDRFVDRTEAAGLADHDSMALGLMALDLDGDGWQDLFAANDGAPNLYLRNQGDGRFVDDALLAGLIAFDGTKVPSGMGLDIAYPEGDDGLCVAVGNFAGEPITLHCRPPDGDALFVETAHAAGLAPPTLPWVTFGLRFFDANLDGRLELAAANGHVLRDAPEKGISRRQPLQLFTAGPRDAAGVTPFAPVPGPLGGVTAIGRALATGDVDLDGDVDLLVVESDGPARLLINESPHRGRSLQIRLVGRASPTTAFGARVTVEGDGLKRRATVSSGTSYGGESERLLTFGVPDGATARSARVDWPSGQSERFALTASRGRVTLREGDGNSGGIASESADDSTAKAEPRRDPRLAAALDWRPDHRGGLTAAEARIALEAAVARGDRHARLGEAIARLSQATGDLAGAAKQLEALVAARPTEPTLRRDLAFVRFEARDLPGAHAEIDAILARVDDPEYLLSRLVVPFVQRGALPLAEPVIRRVRALAPQRQDAMRLHAAIQLGTQDVAAARATAEALLARAPGHGGAQNILGYAALQTGDPKTAEPLFTAVADGHGPAEERADALAGLSVVRAYTQRPRDAAELLVRAYELRAQSETALGAADRFMEADDPAAARAILGKALEDAPGEVPVLGRLAMIEHATGHKKRALALLERLLEIAPGDPDATRLIADWRSAP